MANSLFGEPGKGISLEDLNEGMSAEELNQETPQEPEVQPEPRVEEPANQAHREAEETKELGEQEAKQLESKAEEEPQTQFSFDVLNKELNKNYESLDQIKADLNKPTMESEYEQVKTQLEEWQAKYNDLNETYELMTEQLDPSTYFSSDEAMKLEAFKKANPDKDASIAQKVFSTEDLSSIDDIDMVKMGWRFNTPRLKGTDKDLEIAIAEELNQDPDTPVSEWPVSAQNRLARMAADYTNQFKSIKSSVQLPEKVNIEELKAQRKQAAEQRLTELTDGWSKVADESLKSTSSVKLPIGQAEEGQEQQFFEWAIPNPPEAEVNALKENFIKSGMDPEKDKASFQEVLNMTLFYKDRAQILQKYGEHLLAEAEEKHLEETHNPTPLKDSERTEMTDADKQRAEQTRFAVEDVVPRFRSSPLFKKR